MKKVAITGPRQATLVEADDPRAAANLVVVKVHAAPMCAEYKAYVGGHGGCLGHEAAGEVVSIAQPGRVKVGDRVVAMPLEACGRCDHCLSGNYIFCEHGPDVAAITGCSEGGATYAQYIIKSDWLLVPIPEGMSYEHASMACCGLGPTFGAMQRMNVTAFGTVLITGAGPVGLGGVINARYRNARVIVAEGNTYRAAKARKLGADAVVDPADPQVLDKIRQLSGGGVDFGIDCSGVPAAHRLCIDATRRRGQVALVGETYAYGATELFGSQDMIRKGLTLHGSWHYNLADAPKIMQMIQSRAADVDELITHVLPMSRVQEAFEISASGQCGKIVLRPWE